MFCYVHNLCPLVLDFFFFFFESRPSLSGSSVRVAFFFFFFSDGGGQRAMGAKSLSVSGPCHCVSMSASSLEVVSMGEQPL